MLSRTHLLAVAAAVAGLLPAAAVQADSIRTTQITPSTTLPFFTFGGQQFTIDQLHDGITADRPFNGFAANQITSGRITLTFDQLYDLESFTLWNDVNVQNEGLRSFTLSFEDAGGNALGSTGVLTAVSMLAPQTYSFASTVAGVKTVQLDVLTSIFQIEIRELEFSGVATVPEPGTWAMMLAGLLGVGALVRSRAG